MGGCTGGSAGLVAWLVGEHRDELAVDFRTLYHVGIADVRGHELSALIYGLIHDTRSWTHAAIAEWDYPLSREAMHQLDTIDVILARWMPKGQFKPVKRPSDRADAKRRAQRINDPALLAKLRPRKAATE